uniref:Transmembrane channel-like protein n=1 Tax=Neolamprologus brichardi TaxID=32507 RepID=A0A3Q4N9V9_NEOBR
SGQLSRGPRDKTSMQPLRNLPISLNAMFMLFSRERRKLENNDINFWESWRKTQSTNRKRVREQIKEALSGLVPWRQTLRTIEGKFGVGVKSYFVFLRYLIYLNLLHCVLIGGFIVGPSIFYRTDEYGKSAPHMFPIIFSLSFLQGYVNRSLVFYGFYTRGSLELKCLNTPLLYLAGIFSVIFLSLILHTWMLGKRYSMNVSYKIFCGWDFTIQDPTAAALKHGFIRNDLKVSGVALTPSYLLLQYFPPITITFVNLVLPHIFRKISSFEDYSFTMQVNVTLLSIFLKLASLGIYLFFVFTTTEQDAKCKENQFGREMYKLSIFNFLATFFNTYPRSLLARISGKQRFLIPFNVLDLVYSQTVSWVGVYYCPLLPKRVRFSLQLHLTPPVLLSFIFNLKPFRIRIKPIFIFYLYFLLICIASAIPRTSCGPFRNEQTMFTVTGDCVKSLPSPAQTTILCK